MAWHADDSRMLASFFFLLIVVSGWARVALYPSIFLLFYLVFTIVCE